MDSTESKIPQDGNIDLIDSDILQYKTLYPQDLPEQGYLEMYPSIGVAATESLAAASYALNDIINRWDAYYHSRSVLRFQMRDHLLNRGSTFFINTVLHFKDINHSSSPWINEEDNNNQNWCEDEEPRAPPVDVTMSFTRQVATFKALPVDLSQNNAANFTPMSTQQGFFPPILKKTGTAISLIKSTIEGIDTDAQSERYLIDALSPQSIGKSPRTFRVSKNSVYDKDIVDPSLTPSSPAKLKNQSSTKLNLNLVKTESDLTQKKRSLTLRDKEKTEPAQISLNAYYNRKMLFSPKNDQDREVDQIIDWARKKKLKDEARLRELLVSQNSMIAGATRNKLPNLNDGKTKYTFTHEGKLLLIDPNGLRADKLPKALAETRLKPISDGAKVLKKGVEKTLERVLKEIADESQISKGSKKKKIKESEDQDFNSEFKASLNPSDIMSPSTGVQCFYKDKHKSGKSIDDQSKELNKMSRTMYFSSSLSTSQQQFSSHHISILNNTEPQGFGTQKLGHGEVRKNSRAQSQQDSASLQTIEEQSQEYNNTSGFIQNLHNQLNIKNKRQIIRINANQSDITDMLLIQKEESIFLEDPNIANRRNLSISNAGYLTSRSFLKQGNLLPGIDNRSGTSLIQYTKGVSKRLPGKFKHSQSQRQLFNRTVQSQFREYEGQGITKDEESSFGQFDNKQRESDIQSQDRIDVFNKDILQDKSWGYNTSTNLSSARQPMPKQKEQLSMAKHFADARDQMASSSHAQNFSLKEAEQKKFEQMNEYQMKGKPFSPRLSRLLNKSTFIEKISQQQEAKTSRYEHEVKQYDSDLLKKKWLKTPGIIIPKTLKKNQ